MAKFLFDFDGVLTNQTEEALRVRAIFRSRIVALTGASESETDAFLARADSSMSAEPWNHGWRVDDRISAFADEDLFIRNNGLAACLDDRTRDDARLGEIRNSLSPHAYDNFCALSQFAYEEMARETKAGAHEPIDDATPHLLRGLLERGHKLVVVSNSGTDRIIRILSGCGLDPKPGEANADAPLRVRGGARKFVLGNPARTFHVGRYLVDTARPIYEAILREEKPSGVIGDVFSLDLALPLELARSSPETFGGMKIVLRTRDYTPAWSKEFMRSTHEKNAELHILDRLEDLTTIFTG